MKMTHLLAQEQEYLVLEFHRQLIEKSNNKQQILKDNKAVILEQCRSKLAVISIKIDDPQYKDKVRQVLKETIYSCAHIPVGLIGSSDELETDELEPATGEVTDYNKIARNVFRYIVRGTEVDAKRGNIKKGLAFVENALTKKRHSGLSFALREEFQTILTNIAQRLVKPPGNDIGLIEPDDEKQYEILISNLLAAYPFLDPHEDKVGTLFVPQKINGIDWCNIGYRVEKIDVSPQSGLLSKLIRDEDRVYAYGLIPIDPNSPAECQLILMGTTYPSGQGANLSGLRKYNPRHSIGEGYDWSLLEKWIEGQSKKIKLTGHSQGGTSAMCIAAMYADKISRADCLNPPALCKATLNRLNPNWEKIPKHKRPQIHVYAQQGDPAYPLEYGFLEGTKIFRIIPGADKCSNLNPLLPRFFQKTLESHLHHFVGRESSLILQLNAEQESFSYGREFRDDMKDTLNWIFYPFMYSDLVAGFVKRTMKEWCLENVPKALTTSVAVAGFIPYYTLEYALNAILFVIQATLLVTSLLLTALYSGTKVGIKALFDISDEPQSYELRSH
jgi:pimeloyl-ACP methyl ester carboxylesterase